MAELPYDALLVASFGGPEGPDEVVPFLEHVTAGRGVPRERLVEVGAHYFARGGVSPINAQNRALIAVLQARLDEAGPALPVYWGNRHAAPFLGEAVARMAADGVQRALVFVTSAYSSYSACRQYLDAVEAARATVGAGAPVIDKLRAFFNHPGFVEPMVDNVVAALGRLGTGAADTAALVFSGHSIPIPMARSSAYVEQLREASRLIVDGVLRVTGSAPRWDLVWQSRSGPPGQPWLEPDVGDHLAVLAADGVERAVFVPVGFISDHMEVVHDLDTAATARAAQLGLTVTRAATVGTDPRFVDMIRELVLERVDAAEGRQPLRRALGPLGPSHDVCAPDCCPAPARPPASGRARGR